MSKEHKRKNKDNVVRSAKVTIVHSDIATVEALHDLLLDVHDYSLDFITLKKARKLIEKMYYALKQNNYASEKRD